MRMLEILSRDRHPEVEGDDITGGDNNSNAMENAPLCIAFVP